MSEKRASTGGYPTRPPEPRAGEPVGKLADHLGRLLTHADRLLAEWQAHADGMRVRFEREAEASGAILARTLEAALAEASRRSSETLQRGFGANAESLRVDLERARQAAADLEAHMKRIAGGAKPGSVDELRQGIQGLSSQLRALAPEKRGSMAVVLLAVTANLMLAAVLFVLLREKPAAAPPAVSPEPEPIAVVVPPPDAGPPPAPEPPPACGAITLDGVATAAKLARACAILLCEPPAKLADCRAEGAAGDLVAALRSLERDKVLPKLGCPLPEKDGDGRYPVTVRWLLDCPLHK